ncbi:MAG: nucleoside hydrolase [Nitrospinae bacterium]|nr:nucleoside hydrolase [Nitrospinota bacterium]
MAGNESGSPVRYALVDCDPGVDDTLALAMGFASPFFRYDAVTTVHGNVSARLAYRNARRLTAFLRDHLESPVLDVPVYPGASLALDGSRMNRSESRAIHGPEGMGAMFDKKRRLPRPGRGSSKPAWEVMVEEAARRGSALTIITLGPLTNLALALRRAPGVFTRVKRIVVMGGAARMPGNVTPAAEFNIYCDPLAAKEVFSSGLPVTMVGLDVTRRALLRVDEFEGGGPFRAAIRDLIKVYARFAKKRRGAEDITLHDPLALAVAMRPDLVETTPCRVDVDASRGIARGMTVVELRENRGSRVKNPVDVALDLDVKGFLAFFISHLRKYRGWDEDEK